MPDQSNKLLTTKEVAEFLSFNQNTLANWRTINYGPDFLIVGKNSVRYPLSSVMDFAYNSTSVQPGHYSSLLINNTQFRKETQSFLNDLALKAKIDDANTIKDLLEATKINGLDFLFDKLIVNLELSDVEGNVFESKLLRKEERGLVFKIDKSVYPYRHGFRVKLYSNEDIAFSIFYSDTTNNFNYKVQIQLNPSHFYKKQLNQLHKVLKYLFGKSYKIILLNAYVSRFDICFDMPGVNVDSVIFNFKNTRKSHVVRTGLKKKNVYTSLGSRRRNRCKAYLRKNSDITRVEFEFYPKSKSLKLLDLLTYKMPFDRFEIFSPEFLLMNDIHPHTVHAIEALGLKQAIATLTDKKESFRLKKAVKENVIMTNPKQFELIARKKMSPFMKELLKK